MTDDENHGEPHAVWKERIGHQLTFSTSDLEDLGVDEAMRAEALVS